MTPTNTIGKVLLRCCKAVTLRVPLAKTMSGASATNSGAVLPALVKYGRWRGRLTFVSDDGLVPVSAVIVAHRDRHGERHGLDPVDADDFLDQILLPLKIAPMTRNLPGRGVRTWADLLQTESLKNLICSFLWDGYADQAIAPFVSERNIGGR